MNVHDTWKPHQAEPGQIGAPRLAPGRGPWPPKYLGKRRIRSAGFVYVIMHNYCWTGRVLQERKMSPNIEIMKTHPHHHHDQYPCGSKVKTDHKFATILSLIGPIVMYQLTANQHFLGQLSHLCSQGATYPGLLQGSRIQAFFTEDWVISIRLEITGIVPQISGKTSPVRPIPTPRAKCCDRQSPVTLAETSCLGNFICCWGAVCGRFQMFLLVNKWLRNLAGALVLSTEM